VADILIVDDDAAICQFMQIALEEYGGFHVHAAASAEEALSLLERTPFDAAIIDVVLGRTSGFALAAEVWGRGIPVIMMTAAPGAEEQLVAARWRHLSKPFRIERLIGEVRDVIASPEENRRAVFASLQRLAALGEEHQDVVEIAEAALRSRPTGEREPDGANARLLRAADDA
jgi:two-component system OmpR family response regulator